MHIRTSRPTRPSTRNRNFIVLHRTYYPMFRLLNPLAGPGLARVPKAVQFWARPAHGPQGAATRPLAANCARSHIATRCNSTWQRYNRHYGRNRINWRSLAKPAAFTAAFCLGTTVAAPYVFSVAPFSYFRSNPRLLVYTLVGLNVAGFFMWRYPPVGRFMTRYCLLMKENIRLQWLLLGLAFSHQEPFHLLFNMLMLYSFGTSFASAIGAANFLVLYLNSAVFLSFLSIAIPTILRLSMAVASLGASGALFGVFGAFAWLVPRASVAIFFLPIPGGAWFLFLGSIAFNAAGVILRWGRYDYAAHLGGCVAGAAYGWYFSALRRSRAKARSHSAWT